MYSGKLGLRPTDIHSAIAVAIRGQDAGFVLEGDRRFDIMVRFPEEFRANPSALDRLPIAVPFIDSKNGLSLYDQNSDLIDARPKTVPLSDLAELKFIDGPNQISRENGKRRIVVQGNVRNKDLGS